MGYVVTTEAATVYKVRYARADDEPHHFGWADAAVRSWSGGGSISIQSDYGTYANTWTATGPGRFVDFLCHLDFDYFMTKACPNYRVFDHEKSVRNIKRRIIEQRRDGSMYDLTKDQARELWEDLERYSSDSTSSADYFVCQLMESRALSHWFDGDYADIALYSANPQAVGFWKEIWPHLVATWRSDMAQAA